MTSEHVQLPNAQAEFIQQLVATGRYGSADEAIRAGVLLLQERIAHEERKKEELRALLDRAFAGGVAEESFDEIWDAAEERYLKDHA